MAIEKKDMEPYEVYLERQQKPSKSYTEANLKFKTMMKKALENEPKLDTSEYDERRQCFTVNIHR